jgi:hypothetical protein
MYGRLKLLFTTGSTNRRSEWNLASSPLVTAI